jgi:hypothetical protein
VGTGTIKHNSRRGNLLFRIQFKTNILQMVFAFSFLLRGKTTLLRRRTIRLGVKNKARRSRSRRIENPGRLDHQLTGQLYLRLANSFAVCVKKNVDFHRGRSTPNNRNNET